MKAPLSEADFVKQESIYGRLPLLPDEREYDTRGAHSTSFAFAVATWCFLTGGYVAQYVGAIQGMVALIAGSVVGCFLTTMPLALASQRGRTALRRGSKHHLFGDLRLCQRPGSSTP